MNSIDFRITADTACVGDMLAYMKTYDVCVLVMRQCDRQEKLLAC